MAQKRSRLLKVIRSRSRSRQLSTHKVVPGAVLVVPESEVEEYRHHGLDIVAIPDEVAGVARVTNWILRRFDEEFLVIFDDDILRCLCLVHDKRHRLTPSEVDDLVYVTAECAADAGLSLFGWRQSVRLRMFLPLAATDMPFMLSAWVGGAFGLIGRKFWFDENLVEREDVDFSLQHLLHERVIWQDARFYFEARMDNNAGGSWLFRTPQTHEACCRYLRRKWGRYITFRGHSRFGGAKAGLHVIRRQELTIR